MMSPGDMMTSGSKLLPEVMFGYGPAVARVCVDVHGFTNH